MAAKRTPKPAGLPKELPAVVALAGDDERKKERFLEQITKRHGDESGVIRWSQDTGDKPEAELSRLLADLRSRPLFGGAKLIVVRDGDTLLKRQGKALQRVLEIEVAGGNRLVMLFRALDQRTTFARGLKTAGGLVPCARPQADLEFDARRGHAAAGDELLREVQAEAKSRGLAVEPPVAMELAGRTGNDLMRISSELDKLALYVGDKGRVDKADVEQMVPRSVGWDQFRLFQEVATGDAAAALKRLRGMFLHGSLERRGNRRGDPRSVGIGLLAMLHNRLRQLARYRELSDHGLTKDAMVSALGIRNPGQLYYLGREAGMPLVGAADRAIHAMADADRGLKLGQPPELLLEGLVVRLARLARRADAPGGGRRRGGGR